MADDFVKDALGHHVWATMAVIDACRSLDPAQLDATETGTYGSILATLRHMVGADAFYLGVLAPGHAPRFDESTLSLDELRDAMHEVGRAWSWWAAQDRDLGEVLGERDEDGYERDATASLRLAQAVHHGTDHRSQICTILSALGRQPPDIDVWRYGMETGRVSEVRPWDEA